MLQRQDVKRVGLALLSLVPLLLIGCAASTVESRIKERPAAFAGLSPDAKASVAQGQIKVGMSPDAVYLAWGAPAQVLRSENAGGASTVWLYTGGYMEQNRYWYYKQLEYDYQPRTYVSAEVVFVNGAVSEWRTLPQPVN